MRFIHVADVHLDTAFSGRSDMVRSRLREASREAFRRAVDLAIREDVHAFLIAGDLFDGDRLSFQTERFLVEQIARLDHGDITVVYATGNHDPGSPEAGPRPLPLPASTRVAWDSTPQRILVHDAEGDPIGWVSAVGHATDRESRDLSRLLPRPDGELPEVALLHTQVHSSLGAEAHHSYAPSDLSYLIRSGYDYWALGHVHVQQELSTDPPVVYAGSLQGRTHTDTGPRGALLVDLSDRHAPAISFRDLAPVRWETLTVGQLDDAESIDLLERKVHAAWRTLREAEPVGADVEWMIRVRLEGACPMWRDLRSDENLRMVAKELTGLLGALDVVVEADRVHPVIPLEEHRTRTDVLGASLELLDRVRRKEVTLTLVRSGDLAGMASDDPSRVQEYVFQLMNDVDGELAARLLGSETSSS